MTQVMTPSKGQLPSSGISGVFNAALAPLLIIRRDLHSEIARSLINEGGGSGLRRNPLPADWRGIQAALDGLPSLPVLIAARHDLRKAIRAKATDEQIAKIVGAILSMKPGDWAKRASYVEGLACALIFEANCSPVSPYVLAAAFYRAVFEIKYPPDILEIMSHIPATESLFRSAPRRCDLLIEAREELELEWGLLQKYPDADMPNYCEETENPGGRDDCPV